MWISFDKASSNQATILSFGGSDGDSTVSLNASHILAGNSYYLVAVANRLHGYVKVYLNGTQTAFATLTPTTGPLLGANALSERANFIGSNSIHAGPGLIASVHSLKIWSGELSPAAVKINSVVGDDPATLYIGGDLTMQDVNVSFVTPSTQRVQISAYGGATIKVPMFDSRMKFNLAATNPSCKFQRLVSLKSSSSAVIVEVPAFSFDITLDKTSSVVPAPNITSSYACTPAKSPYEYFSISNQLTQQLAIFQVQNASYLYRNDYEYHTGVCAQFVGLENAPKSVGTVISGDTCFAADSVILEQGQALSIETLLFELYPQDAKLNRWSYPYATLTGDVALVDHWVSDAVVSYFDGVGGPMIPNVAYVPKNISHNFTDGSGYLQWVGQPYLINATRLLTVAPFALPFIVVVDRAGPDGLVTLYDQWYIPVTGVLPNKVPNLYVATSDPTLIYLIIRDPPGGSSYTKIHSGTKMEFGLSVEDVRTFDNLVQLQKAALSGIESEVTKTVGTGIAAVSTTSTNYKLSTSFPVEEIFKIFVKIGGNLAAGTPVGKIISSTGALGAKAAAIIANTAYDKLYDTISPSTGTPYSLTMSHRYFSSSEYLFSATFDSDISTSTDPNLAGQASDVIVGGGVNLIVVQATEVLRTQHGGPDFICLNNRDTYLWQPQKASTFVMSVYEIERTIEQLADILNGNGTSTGQTKAETKQFITNWQTVLDRYRASTIAALEDNEFFGPELQQINDMIEQFGVFTSDMLNEDGWVNVPIGVLAGFSVFGKGLPPPLDIIVNAIQTLATEDGVGILALIYKKKFKLESICYPSSKILHNFVPHCSDFDFDKWTSFSSFLSKTCNLRFPNEDDATSSNLINSNSLYATFCTKGPKGDSMFEFLEDKDKYLSFGSNAPFVMKFGSTVSQKISFGVDFGVKSFSEAEYFTRLQVETDLLTTNNHQKLSFASTKTVNIGKTSSQLNDLTRDVTVHLGDNDAGDYFSIKMSEDPVYGTPVFSTIGGQSKCPAETGTSAREGAISYLAVLPRCGTGRNKPCVKTTLQPGDPATFSVFVVNSSPTKEAGYYTLSLAQTFDYAEANYASAVDCSISKRLHGLLRQNFDREYYIPYGKMIEIPIGFDNGNAGLSLLRECDSFSGIEIRLSATCEMPRSGSSVYQYGLVKVNGQSRVSYAKADRQYGYNVTAVIPDFSFPTSYTQRTMLSHDQNNHDTHSEGYRASDELTIQTIVSLERQLHLFMTIVIALLTVIFVGVLMGGWYLVKHIRRPFVDGTSVVA